MSRITLNLKKAGVQFKSDSFSAPKTLLFDRGQKGSNLLDGNLAFNIVSTPLPVSSASIRPYEHIRTFSSCSKVHGGNVEASLSITRESRQ